jgi:UDP-2,3-diacylglucosamine hydrolase
MSHLLFISDLHLCHTRPAITETFIQFLQSTALEAKALYVLGDLFEYWPGDDAITHPHFQAITKALKNVCDAGLAVFLMHGNRDFLIGKSFTDFTGVTLLNDPTEITFFGKKIVLSHGDALCTDDTSYQVFRAEVRTSAWQARFLAQNLDARIAYIEKIRDESEQAKSTKSMTIMDVNLVAVADLFQEFPQTNTMIHGHTHRPKQHVQLVESRKCERWVLGDWYEQGSCLRLAQNGIISSQSIN